MSQYVERHQLLSEMSDADQRACIAMRTLSGRDMSYYLGVDASQVTRWVAVGMPRNRDGTYNWSVCRAWLDAEGRWIYQEHASSRSPNEVRLLGLVFKLEIEAAQRHEEDRRRDEKRSDERRRRAAPTADVPGSARRSMRERPPRRDRRPAPPPEPA